MLTPEEQDILRNNPWYLIFSNRDGADLTEPGLEIYVTRASNIVKLVFYPLDRGVEMTRLVSFPLVGVG